MNVHAVAGAGAVGLRHEGGGETVLAGDALDDTLEEDRIVRRLQGIVAVQQIDLELADAVLRDRRIRRNVLPRALPVDVGEELAEVVELVDRKDSVGIEPLAGIRRDRRDGAVRLRIYEVKFKLRRHHRAKAQFAIFAHDCREGLPRVGEKGSAVLYEEP